MGLQSTLEVRGLRVLENMLQQRQQSHNRMLYFVYRIQYFVFREQKIPKRYTKDDIRLPDIQTTCKEPAAVGRYANEDIRLYLSRCFLIFPDAVLGSFSVHSM
jgi:hypothetical protein